MSKTFVEKIATFVKGHKRRLEEISRCTKFTNGVPQYGNSVNSSLTHMEISCNSIENLTGFYVQPGKLILKLI